MKTTLAKQFKANEQTASCSIQIVPIEFFRESPFDRTGNFVNSYKIIWELTGRRELQYFLVSMILPVRFCFKESAWGVSHVMSVTFYQLFIFHIERHTTGRIEIRVLTNCQTISTEIGTDSLKI